MNKEKIKTILHPAFVLFIIVFVSVALLVFFNDLTKEKIELINAQNSEQARIDVLEQADKFEKADENTDVEIYKGYKGEELVGYCVFVIPKGYGGDIEMMVGVDNDLKVTGVKIINSSETAGLGKNAEKQEFTDKFKGLEKGINVVKNGADKENNEIDALSGATITTKAVSGGVDTALLAVEKIIDKGAAK